MSFARSKELRTVQTAFLSQGSESTLNQTFRHEELHVFVMDEKDIKKSIGKFVELYSVRTRKSREFWLVDITQLTKNVPKENLIEQIQSDFKDLPLDLDDDLYLFSGI